MMRTSHQQQNSSTRFGRAEHKVATQGQTTTSTSNTVSASRKEQNHNNNNSGNNTVEQYYKDNKVVTAGGNLTTSTSRCSKENSFMSFYHGTGTSGKQSNHQQAASQQTSFDNNKTTVNRKHQSTAASGSAKPHQFQMRNSMGAVANANHHNFDSSNSDLHNSGVVVMPSDERCNSHNNVAVAKRNGNNRNSVKLVRTEAATNCAGNNVNNHSRPKTPTMTLTAKNTGVATKGRKGTGTTVDGGLGGDARFGTEISLNQQHQSKNKAKQQSHCHEQVQHHIENNQVSSSNDDKPFKSTFISTLNANMNAYIDSSNTGEGSGLSPQVDQDSSTQHQKTVKPTPASRQPKQSSQNHRSFAGGRSSSTMNTTSTAKNNNGGAQTSTSGGGAYCATPTARPQSRNSSKHTTLYQNHRAVATASTTAAQGKTNATVVAMEEQYSQQQLEPSAKNMKKDNTFLVPAATMRPRSSTKLTQTNATTTTATTNQKQSSRPAWGIGTKSSRATPGSGTSAYASKKASIATAQQEATKEPSVTSKPQQSQAVRSRSRLYQGTVSSQHKQQKKVVTSDKNTAHSNSATTQGQAQTSTAVAAATATANSTQVQQPAIIEQQSANLMSSKRKSQTQTQKQQESTAIVHNVVEGEQQDHDSLMMTTKGEPLPTQSSTSYHHLTSLEMIQSSAEPINIPIRPRSALGTTSVAAEVQQQQFTSQQQQQQKLLSQDQAQEEEKTKSTTSVCGNRNLGSSAITRPTNPTTRPHSSLDLLCTQNISKKRNQTLSSQAAANQRRRSAITAVGNSSNQHNVHKKPQEQHQVMQHQTQQNIDLQQASEASVEGLALRTSVQEASHHHNFPLKNLQPAITAAATATTIPVQTPALVLPEQPPQLLSTTASMSELQKAQQLIYESQQQQTMYQQMQQQQTIPQSIQQAQSILSAARASALLTTAGVGGSLGGVGLGGIQLTYEAQQQLSDLQKQHAQLENQMMQLILLQQTQSQQQQQQPQAVSPVIAPTQAAPSKQPQNTITTAKNTTAVQRQQNVNVAVKKQQSVQQQQNNHKLSAQRQNNIGKSQHNQQNNGKKDANGKNQKGNGLQIVVVDYEDDQEEANNDNAEIVEARVADEIQQVTEEDSVGGPPVPSTYQGPQLEELVKTKQQTPKARIVFSKSDQKLAALIQGYKTRRILADHQIVSKLRTDYSDLLSFAFGLQQELKSLDPCEQQNQVKQVKQLLIQSVKDLNHKRMQFNDIFYQVHDDGARWLEHSRTKELGEKLAERKSFEGFKPPIKQRSSYQLKSNTNQKSAGNLQMNNLKSIVINNDLKQVENQQPMVQHQQHSLTPKMLGRTMTNAFSTQQSIQGKKSGTVAASITQSCNNRKQQSQPQNGIEATASCKSANRIDQLYEAYENEQNLLQSSRNPQQSILSQSLQPPLNSSAQPKVVKQQNFLKKGDKSRVYDPRQSIKLQKRQAAEYTNTMNNHHMLYQQQQRDQRSATRTPSQPPQQQNNTATSADYDQNNIGLVDAGGRKSLPSGANGGNTSSLIPQHRNSFSNNQTTQTTSMRSKTPNQQSFAFQKAVQQCQISNDLNSTGENHQKDLVTEEEDQAAAVVMTRGNNNSQSRSKSKATASRGSHHGTHHAKQQVKDNSAFRQKHMYTSSLDKDPQSSSSMPFQPIQSDSPQHHLIQPKTSNTNYSNPAAASHHQQTKKQAQTTSTTMAASSSRIASGLFRKQQNTQSSNSRNQPTATSLKQQASGGSLVQQQTQHSSMMGLVDQHSSSISNATANQTAALKQGHELSFANGTFGECQQQQQQRRSKQSSMNNFNFNNIMNQNQMPIQTQNNAGDYSSLVNINQTD